MFASRNFLLAKGVPLGFGGKLFVWGSNGNGSLGVGDTIDRSSPVQVGATTDWSRVAIGTNSLGVKNNGTLWAWGSGYYGALGQNNTIARSSPVQVGALTNWSIPEVGASHSFCIKTDGTLWSWGNSNYGQLGHNTVTRLSSPVQIGASTGWTAISAGDTSAGDKSTLAVDNGKLFSWGRNYIGQLGINNTTDRSSPVQIGALTTWATPSSARHMLCTKTDGTLWSWGLNTVGELGLGNLTTRSSPVQIGALTNWSVPTVAASWSLCTKTDGTLWAWGDNRHGSLGLGDVYIYPPGANRRSSPVQVGSLTNWAIPFVGNASGSGCLKTDGTLWAWGRNLNGSSGLGDVVERSSPVQIGNLTTWTLPSKFEQVNACLQTP